jgi:hypothetical protein
MLEADELAQRRRRQAEAEVERVEIADVLRDPAILAGLSPESGRVPGHPIRVPAQPAVADEEPPEKIYLNPGYSTRLEGHTIAAAMRRKELTEEEAYFVLRFAGHMGYERAIRLLSARNPLRLFRRWLVYISGWETPELMQWDMGVPAWKLRLQVGDNAILARPWPVAMFGHRFKIFSYGLSIHLPNKRILCITHLPTWAIYTSPDGTPSHRRAHYYLGRRED